MSAENDLAVALRMREARQKVETQDGMETINDLMIAFGIDHNYRPGPFWFNDSGGNIPDGEIIGSFLDCSEKLVSSENLEADDMWYMYGGLIKAVGSANVYLPDLQEKAKKLFIDLTNHKDNNAKSLKSAFECVYGYKFMNDSDLINFGLRCLDKGANVDSMLIDVMKTGYIYGHIKAEEYVDSIGHYLQVSNNKGRCNDLNFELIECAQNHPEVVRSFIDIEMKYLQRFPEKDRYPGMTDDILNTIDVALHNTKETFLDKQNIKLICENLSKIVDNNPEHSEKAYDITMSMAKYVAKKEDYSEGGMKAIKDCLKTIASVNPEIKNKVIKNEAKQNIKNLRKERVSGVVVADKIADEIRNGVVTDTVTPKKGKQMAKNIKKQVNRDR